MQLSFCTPALASLPSNPPIELGRYAIMARGWRVGIDIDSIPVPRDPDLLFKKSWVCGTGHFSAKSFAPERVRAFHASWPCKEALAKAIGMGIGHRIASMDLPILRPDGRVTLDDAGATRSDGRTWMVSTTWLSEVFVLSTAFEE